MKTKIVTLARVISHNGKFVVEEKGYYTDEGAKSICELTNQSFPPAYSMISGGHDTELEAAAYLEVRVTGIPQEELDKIHASR